MIHIQLQMWNVHLLFRKKYQPREEAKRYINIWNDYGHKKLVRIWKNSAHNA